MSAPIDEGSKTPELEKIRVVLTQEHTLGPCETLADVLKVWRSFLSCELTFVGQFDRAGLRHLVMRRSDEHVDGAGLSFREVEILRRVSRGDSNKVIAYDLELSVSTVATHLSQASRKLGLGPKVLVHAALVLGRLADRLDM